MRCKLLALVGGLLLAAVPASASITIIWPPFYPELLAKSELIVVGRTGTPQSQGEEPYTFSWGGEICVERFSVPVTVERVIKGDPVPRTLSVDYFVQSHGCETPPTKHLHAFFWQVPADEVCLLCVARERETRYELTPKSGSGSVLRVGRAMPYPGVEARNPLEGLIEQFLFSAGEEDLDSQTRLTCLGAVMGLALCACRYHESVPESVPDGAGGQVSSDQMRALVEERIWPRLLEVTQGDDQEVVAAAWRTLARLQCPGAVTGLVALAHRGDIPTCRGCSASALGAYYCGSPGLAALLAPLLDDPDVRIRRGAASSLANVADQSTLRQLLGALDDADSKVRRSAACALSKVTGTGHCPSADDWGADAEEVVEFWRDWAAQHPNAAKTE